MMAQLPHVNPRGLRLAYLLAVTAGLLISLTSSILAADPPKTGEKGAEMVGIINEAIKQGWDDNKITPSKPCTDSEFIRRASLDIIGRIATPAEVAAFAAQPVATRRAWLIEQLLKSEEYPRHWANMWANWLLTRSGAFGGRSSYHEDLRVWLEDQLAQNIPFNQLVTKLVTAKGKNRSNPEVNFILAHVGELNPQNVKGEQGQFDMVPVTSRITRLFLGTQTQCAQCHDHPFDGRIKQQDFWGMNGFLRQVERRGQPMMANNNNQQNPGPELELIINTSNNEEGYVSYEKRNGVILKTKPVFFSTGKPANLKEDRRDELAKFIIDHPQFTKAFVNRMWGHFMGRGFVNPVDDFNEQNQPSHPELLGKMANNFSHYGYDMKNVIRWICNSQAYNLSSTANKTNEKPDTDQFFSRMQLKVMSPEELFESIVTATSVSMKPEDKKKLRDTWMQNLVANFGDDEGNEVNYSGTVVQALLMMNGKDLNDLVANPEGLVKTLKTKYKVNDINSLSSGVQTAMIKDIYMATLNRVPSNVPGNDELTKVSNAMQLTLIKPTTLPNGKPGQPMVVPIQEKEVAHRFQDLLWAILNSNEFMLNH
jgi:hypothetical protein